MEEKTFECTECGKGMDKDQIVCSYDCFLASML